MLTLIKGADIIDGRGKLLKDMSILMDASSIKQIEETELFHGHAVDLTIDATGKTVMPGLIDCHVHITKGDATKGKERSWVGSKHIRTEQEEGFFSVIPRGVRDVITGSYYAKCTLEAGYTTVREVGIAHEYSDIVLREAIKKGFVVGPRILACGGGIAMTGGHAWQQAIAEADGPDEVRKVTRLQLKAGADIIKIMATRAGSAKEEPGGSEFSVEEMRVICEEAHKRGKRVCAHAVGAEGIKNAIKAGVDSIEHGCLLDDECIDLMLENKTYLISTLYPYHNQAKISKEQGFPSYVSQRSYEIMDVYPDNVRRAWERGVKVALGSDCGIQNLTLHGDNAKELEMVVKLAGFSEMEALCLATDGGANVLGLEETIGTIEEGKTADLLILNENPLNDITVFQDPNNIEMVIKEGQVVVRKGRSIL